MSSENMGEEGGGDVAVAEGGGGGAGAGVSRWSPTKEQISLLEGFYREGVRTPSAEQIQEITARLRTYGQIEGKNVFYWFQNHKARQRQKQKQESLLAYSNFVQHRYLHPPSFFPPPAPNVDCGPYYPVPKSELVFPSPSPTDKVLIPAGIARRKRKPGNVRLEDSGSRYDDATALPRRPGNNVDYGGAIETLPLFPLHPTGVLRGTKEAVSGEYSTLSEEASEDQATFDFLSSH